MGGSELPKKKERRIIGGKKETVFVLLLGGGGPGRNKGEISSIEKELLAMRKKRPRGLGKRSGCPMGNGLGQGFYLTVKEGRCHRAQKTVRIHGGKGYDPMDTFDNTKRKGN